MNQPETHWRKDIGGWMTRTASTVDDLIDTRWQYLKTRFGWDGVPKIQPYIGYSNRAKVWLHGRVLTNPPVELSEHSTRERWWDNVAKTYQRFASDEVPGCSIRVELGASTRSTTTDREGYFEIEGEPVCFETPSTYWSTGTLQIVDHPRVAADDSTTACRIMTPSREAKLGIISDVDDTILHTGATRFLTMAKLTFLKNARTRSPLPGVAALYQALQNCVNPIFYVSSSPWNLFDLLVDFLRLNQIPLGPLLLRDLGIDANKFIKDGHEHKLEKVRRILAAYRDLPFVLIGDSGQEDAQLYATAAEEYRDRIRAIFIRDVDPMLMTYKNTPVEDAIERAAAVEVPMYRVGDSVEAAELASRLGLLPESSIATVRVASAKDKQRPMV